MASNRADRVMLPERRLNITDVLHHDGTTWLLTVGFDRAGRAKEIFLVRAEHHAAEQGYAERCAIAASHALQRGKSPSELGAWRDQLTAPPVREPGVCAPLTLAALRLAATIEARDGTVIRESYQAWDARVKRGGPAHAPHHPQQPHQGERL